MTVFADIGSPQWIKDTDELSQQKERQTGYGFSEREREWVSGGGGWLDVVIDTLAFDEEYFGHRESHHVSCRVCGGIYKDYLWTMRNHRIKCGWVV